MPIIDSRNKNGTLSLDGEAFETQSTSVALVPSFAEEGDRVEVLSGDTIEPDEVTSWSLNLGLIQDFEDSDGIIEFLRANAGEVVPFLWYPAGATVVKYAGDVRIRPTTIGGGVAVRLTSEVELPVIGELDAPDYTLP